MNILGIDPGNVQSAYVLWNAKDETLEGYGILENEIMLSRLASDLHICSDVIVCEMVASYGMAVGKTVFETCVWIGRFTDPEDKLVYRKDIKLHFCNSMRAKDTNIRQALIDRFGPPGTKKAPGKLYGVKKDIWSALAVAVYYADTHANGKASE